MSDDFTARLQEVMADLHGEVGRIERVGRALSSAEQRRAGSLRAAAELVQQAIDELAPEAGEPFFTGGATGGASAGGPDYRDSDLAGDDDTPGYSVGDDDTPGYRDDERGGGELA